jgi:hypothetical protein
MIKHLEKKEAIAQDALFSLDFQCVLRAVLDAEIAEITEAL